MYSRYIRQLDIHYISACKQSLVFHLMGFTLYFGIVAYFNEREQGDPKVSMSEKRELSLLLGPII